jgi:hypothetical protein
MEFTLPSVQFTLPCVEFNLIDHEQNDQQIFIISHGQTASH